ncbi:4'-phosphopantetheinyl transferase family protein [Pseudozobellia thermophila]|uniref:4'-phosphopantetheinyl transferase n=1 Tax=Pseudozobellia thermophila TaxID=192903 RepID=A0A1M6IT52_9FLAO|nr:4'-phosphopantetheinyl transferase superfamily protein [Pseudozobellia thermophila]SHJ37650.1 4'-phosphopantetheinyl transferase [Pseudozobellia thermophila]
MKLLENDIQVWFFSVDDFQGDLGLYKALLSDEELQRSQKFKFERDRKLNVMARSALRILAGRYLGRDPGSLGVAYQEFGKPYFWEHPGLRFNISHSDAFIVLAFGMDAELGVDVERIKTGFDVLRIAQNFFSSSEMDSLDKMPKENRYLAFYRLWTRKESFIKAKGSGLSFPLASFSVSIGEEARLLATEWNPGECREWSMRSFRPAPGYIGALSVRAPIRKIGYYQWQGADLV